MRQSRIFLTLLLFLSFSGSCFGEVTTGEVRPSEQPAETVWLDGKLPPSSKIEGGWHWDEDMKQDEAVSHTSTTYQNKSSHSFKTEAAVGLDSSLRIIQYVFLDPQNSPSGIMMKFFLVGEETISVYWEGEEEAFIDADEYITAWYMGRLPNKGQWLRLEIDVKELDKTDAQLEGISFITCGGRVWWGRTIVVREND